MTFMDTMKAVRETATRTRQSIKETADFADSKEGQSLKTQTAKIHDNSKRDREAFEIFSASNQTIEDIDIYTKAIA